MTLISLLGFENFINKQIVVSKIIALLLLILTFILATYQLGIVVGILFNCIALMSIGSLIILLTPLKLINYKNISIVFIIAFLVEQLTL